MLLKFEFMFNVAIIGGEDTANYDLFKNKCIYFLKDKAKSGCGITLYSTGDDFVSKFGQRYGIDVRTFYVKWKSDGKNALKYRTEELLKDCNALIYFDNGIKDQEIIYNIAIGKNIPCRKVKGA